MSESDAKQCTKHAAPTSAAQGMTDEEIGTRYRKKPAVIDAFRMELAVSTQWPAWLNEAWGVERMVRAQDGRYIIRTLEGEMLVNWGDWVIRGVKGELYPCKPDIFEATYEPVEQKRTHDAAFALRDAEIRAAIEQVRAAKEWMDGRPIPQSRTAAWKLACDAILHELGLS